MPIKKQSNSTEFAKSVYKVVKSIPKGKVLSYKEVAEKTGSPRAYRAVASLMKANYDPEIPCHRVIKNNGSLGDYNRGGGVAKQKILISEGWASAANS